MDKRDRFIAELRDEAALVWIGTKVTTLPSREIDPKTARKIRKALNLD